MSQYILLLFVFGTILISCDKTTKPDYLMTSSKCKIIAEVIDAVNEQDAEKYVVKFADDVKVFVESEMKVNGREDLKANRANHFKKHPNVRSEIQHLVEIDNKVIMHDKVWLDDSDTKGRNIVEIFTFENGEVVRVDVIQPSDLFNR